MTLPFVQKSANFQKKAFKKERLHRKRLLEKITVKSFPKLAKFFSIKKEKFLRLMKNRKSPHQSIKAVASISLGLKSLITSEKHPIQKKPEKKRLPILSI